MVFEIRIVYKTPSREWLFLGAGWGVRDYRGPYIAGRRAEIAIDNWALSPNVAATVSLTLSVSNLSEVDALFVRATGNFGSSQTIIKKNDDAVLNISGLFANTSGTNVLIKLETTFGGEGESAVGKDYIVAMSELHLIR